MAFTTAPMPLRLYIARLIVHHLARHLAMNMKTLVPGFLVLGIGPSCPSPAIARRWFGLLVALVLPSLLQAQYGWSTNSNYIYSTNYYGVMIISYVGPGGTVNVPGEIDGRPVVEISGGAFAENQNVTNVAIPDSVYYIGAGAFHDCTNLVGISLSGGLDSIASTAFQNCFALTNVSLPGSLTSLEFSAFESCINLRSINIPSNLVTWGSNVFRGCHALAQVTFEAGLPGIGDEAFIDCGLQLLVIPGSVVRIGNRAFASCYDLTNVVMAAGVADIGFRAFEHCYRLSSVHFPSSLGRIDYGAFFFCENLREILIPHSVTNVGGGAFGYCYNLTTLSIGDGLPGIYGLFYSCSNLNRVIIGAGVTNLKTETFIFDRDDVSLYFRGNAPAFETNCFAGASNATIHYLPGTIGWSPAFANCPTKLWQPSIKSGGFNPSASSHEFGFNISWAKGRNVLVEVSTNLSAAAWTPIATNLLFDDSVFFSDPAWTNHSRRIYRLRSP